MKKFPFSKKAINIMIATALVVTPLASLAPVGGTAIVSAATTSVYDQVNSKLVAEGLTVKADTIT
ncbi:hypothetical protein KHA80_11930 [Anaerobacillus sp. HL2]|nr:hypothetical protein KHA80_11930 [Anaerobacillus sp. HL2]